MTRLYIEEIQGCFHCPNLELLNTYSTSLLSIERRCKIMASRVSVEVYDTRGFEQGCPLPEKKQVMKFIKV